MKRVQKGAGIERQSEIREGKENGACAGDVEARILLAVESSGIDSGGKGEIERECAARSGNACAAGAGSN